MSDSKQSCEVCSKPCSELEGDQLMACKGSCGKVFHLVCVDQCMPTLNAWSTKVGLLWFCRSCRLDFEPGVELRESALQAAMREMFREVQTAIRDLAVRVDSIDGNVKQLNPAARITVKSDLAESEGIMDSPSESPEKTVDISTETWTCTESSSKPLAAPIKSISIPTSNTTQSCTNRVGPLTSPLLNKSEPQLTAKLWMRVFQYLNFINLCQARLVNRQWKKIVDGNRSLMDKFHSKFPENITIERNFEAISMPPATKISFNKSLIAAVGPWWFPKITEKLTQLELISCRISLSNLLEMLQSTPTLANLSLGCGSTLSHHPIVDKYSELRLEKMKVLEIDSVLQDEVTEVFARTFPNLEEFKLLSGYDKCHRGVLNMINALPTLEGISLSAPPSVLSVLAKVNHPLKRVALEVPTGSKGTMNEQLINFAQMHPCLEKFHLKVCGNIETDVMKNGYYQDTTEYDLNNETFKKFILHLPKLKSLSLSLFYSGQPNNYSTFDLLSKDIAHLENLEHFSFHGKSIGTSSGFQYIMVSFSGVSHPKLTELHLNCIGRPGSNHEFGLQEYIGNAPNLRIIRMEHCHLNNWSDVFAPNQLKQWRQLKLCDISILAGSNDDCLFDYFDELRYLELNWLSMSEKFLSTLFRLCPGVEELKLVKMYYVSDSIILLVLQKMKQLRKLTLHECNNIRSDSIRHITQGNNFYGPEI